MDEVQRLRGKLVVEAGIRQAWPFLTLLESNGDGDEYRMYFDTDLKVGADSDEWMDQDNEQTLAALGRLVNLRVDIAAIDPAGNLQIAFDDGSVLQARSDGNAKTTSAPWRIVHVE